MTDPIRPSTDWLPVGRTSNTQYYRAGPGILVAIPDGGLKDTGPAARENVAFQHAFARSEGPPLAVVVQMTGLLSQNGEARRVYAQEMDPALICSAALVAGNPISRAIAAFFLGLTKPSFPTRVFDGFESALGWSASMRSGGGA